jgi:hypothetical protein
MMSTMITKKYQRRQVEKSGMLFLLVMVYNRFSLVVIAMRTSLRGTKQTVSQGFSHLENCELYFQAAQNLKHRLLRSSQ